MDRIDFEPSLRDLIDLKSFNMEPSDGMRRFLEGRAGKPYNKIMMGDINEIFPGIYDQLFLSGIETAMEWYKDIRQQVFGC